MKRTFDLVGSILGFLLLFPIFLIVSCIIKLDNNGPVLFKQERVGKNGKLFFLFKFRSMRNTPNKSKGVFEPGNTSRVTTFGKFLRKTKLDELPQLLNVIIGDMSIVGPRPEVEKWIVIYPDRWRTVLSVKPGITDNSSIVFRNEESLLCESEDPEKTYKEVILPKKLDLYEDYVLNNSFFGDLKIIVNTLFSVILK